MERLAKFNFYPLDENADSCPQNSGSKGLVFSLRVKYSRNCFVWKLILRKFSSNKADLQRSFSTLQYLQIDFTFLNLMHQKKIVKRIASCLRALNINYGRVPFREVSLCMVKVEVLTLHCGREQSHFYRYQHWTKKSPFYSVLFFTYSREPKLLFSTPNIFIWMVSVCGLFWLLSELT